MTDKATTTEEALPQQEQENVLISMLLNIIVPVLVLSKLSDNDRLGPMWALIVAVIIPAGYGIWFAVSRRQANLYSILGVVSVLLTGVLGLLQTDAIWIAIKETIMPLLIGAVVLLSHLRPTPFVASIFLNPQVVDRAKISAALESSGNSENFSKLLWKSSLALFGTLLFSAVLNFFVAQYCLEGKEQKIGAVIGIEREETAAEPEPTANAGTEHDRKANQPETGDRHEKVGEVLLRHVDGGFGADKATLQQHKAHLHQCDQCNRDQDPGMIQHWGHVR